MFATVAVAKKKAKARVPGTKSAPAFPLPDQRAMEGAFAAIVRGATHYAADEALLRAQDLMYEAFDARGARRAALAREAVAISPDCADAYLLLAEETASSVEEARKLLEQGGRARRNAVGARPQRGGCGTPARAAALEPERQPGVRHRQAEWLLWLERYEELDELFAAYEEDDAAAFAYTKALVAFRRHGTSEEAGRLLAEARKQNPHVPAYLSRQKRLPARLPDYIGFGDESEAVDYAASAQALWESVPAALAWLES